MLQRLSYDAWGKRRNADGTALSCTAGLASPGGVNRGFTGQEMIDGVCLINFNARIYDPSIGRFMSPDPIVGDETVPQELNRFSYVLNDPLSLTDPSGLCGFWCVFKDVLAIAVSIVFIEVPGVDLWINAELSGVGITAATVGSGTLALIDAGIAGGLSGLIASGGSLKGAALGALEADLFVEAGDFLKVNAGQLRGPAHIASRFIVHGLVGGLVSEIGQGTFASGFLAGGIGSLAPTPVGRQTVDQTINGTIESAVLGGVGSVLGGGKFQNGAITGAFGYLFNAALHNGRAPYDRHQQGVAKVIAQYQSEGYVIVSTGSVAVSVPGFSTPRFYDFIALDPISKNYVGVEVKTTLYDTINLNGNQVRKDVAVAEGGGLVVSLNLTIKFVSYATYCFACEMLDVRSLYLNGLLQGSNIRVTHIVRPGVYGDGP